MSGAERSYRIALLSFPKAYREERGDEIVATILEGGETRFPRLRELLGLFWAGIGQRGVKAGGERTAGSVRAGIRLGVFALFWLNLVAATPLLYWRIFPPLPISSDAPTVSPFDARYTYAWPVVGLLILLALSRGWWATPLAITCGWILLGFLVGEPWRETAWWPNSHWQWNVAAYKDSAFVLLLSLLVILARPRKGEPRDLRSPLWAVAALAWIALSVCTWHFGWSFVAHASSGLSPVTMYAHSGPTWLFTWFSLISVVAVVITWLLLGWRDLRLTIAVATLTTYACLDLAFPRRHADPYFTASFNFLVGEFLLLLMIALPIAIGLLGRRRVSS